MEYDAKIIRQFAEQNYRSAATTEGGSPEAAVGGLLGPLGLIVLWFSRNSDKIPCPFCKEPVLPDAVICPHCRSSLGKGPGPSR